MAIICLRLAPFRDRPKRPDIPPPSGLRLDTTTGVRAVINHAALRLSEHAFWIVASHGPARRDGGICAACQHPWRCPDAIWAAQWIAYTVETSLLERLGVELGGGVASMLATWADQPGVSGTEPANG
jgi:hypothetical protein